MVQGGLMARVLQAVRKADHRGVDAHALTSALVEEAGCPAPAARLAIQGALEGGILRLGAQLRLYENKDAAEHQAHIAT